jgi:hypothetical protein
MPNLPQRKNRSEVGAGHGEPSAATLAYADALPLAGTRLEAISGAFRLAPIAPGAYASPIPTMIEVNDDRHRK